MHLPSALGFGTIKDINLGTQISTLLVVVTSGFEDLAVDLLNLEAC